MHACIHPLTPRPPPLSDIYFSSPSESDAARRIVNNEMYGVDSEQSQDVYTEIEKPASSRENQYEYIPNVNVIT